MMNAFMDFTCKVWNFTGMIFVWIILIAFWGFGFYVIFDLLRRGMEL